MQTPVFEDAWTLGVDQALSLDAKTLRSVLRRLYSDFHTGIAVSFPQSRARASLDEVREEASLENWDGYGAKPIDLVSYANAVRFLDVIPKWAPAPEASVDPDGEVSFEWYVSRRHTLSVSVGRNRELSYAGLIGPNTVYGTAFLVDEIPPTILEILRRVYASL